MGGTLHLSAQNYDIEQELEIETVTVTSSASQPVVKQSAPVQIIGKEKMESLGMRFLDDAVSTFSGVNITDYGGVGGVKTVSIRSLGAHHTAVSYDGVVISNAQGGQVDIGSFTLDNIDEVSLTIGQGDEIFQSARSFESSGVLNIKSRAPRFYDRPINVGAKMEMGSFGFYHPTLNLDVKLSDRWSLTALGDWMKSDGDYPFTLTNNKLVTEELRLNSDVNTIRSEVNIYGNVGKRNGKVYIKGNYLDSERGLPGVVIYYNPSNKERLWDKTRFVQAGYKIDFNPKWSFQTNAKYNYAWNKYIDFSNKYQGGKLENRYTQEEYYANATVRFRPNDKWSISYAQDAAENKLVTTLTDCPDPYRLTILSALASQYKNERLTLTGSLFGVYIHEWALNDTYDIAPDRKHISPSLSLSYKILNDQDFRVRASLKDAYRVPTFNDLYYSIMGNLNLTPEEAMQYNVGVTYGGRFLPSILDFASLSVDAYYNKISNKIVAIPTMFIWKMINLGEVDIRGVDINAATHFTVINELNFNISANYTYQRAIDVTDPSDKTYGDQIPYTPLHSGNITAMCHTRWIDFGYTASLIGERYSLPQNIDRNKIDGYIDQNVNISRSFDWGDTKIKLQAEVLNICNVNYDVIKFYPMPGRQFKFSINFNY